MRLRQQAVVLLARYGIKFHLWESCCNPHPRESLLHPLGLTNEPIINLIGLTLSSVCYIDKIRMPF